MEYLDKNGLAHLVQKNNETYALKSENSVLKGKVESLKAKLKKRDKKIVVRKAINPNSVNEGNVWYYHQHPTLLMGRGCSRHKIFINGEELTESYLKVKSGERKRGETLQVQYSNEQKRYWIFYKDSDGKRVMWEGGKRGIAVDLGDKTNYDGHGYLSRVTAVDYDKSLNMRIVYIEMKAVKNFTATTSNPYLRIELGHIISTGKLPFLKNRLSFKGTDVKEYPLPDRQRKKNIALYYWRHSQKTIKKEVIITKRKYFLCTSRKRTFRRGKYMIKIFKKGIYCGKMEFMYYVFFRNNSETITYHTRKI